MPRPKAEASLHARLGLVSHQLRARGASWLAPADEDTAVPRLGQHLPHGARDLTPEARELPRRRWARAGVDREAVDVLERQARRVHLAVAVRDDHDPRVNL